MHNEIVNAKIIGTFLGKEDHGIPTCQLKLRWGGYGQSFGGYDLRFYGINMVMRILEVIGVESWEELPDKYCRIKQCHTEISAIGHITDDKWYCPKEEPDQCQP